MITHAAFGGQFKTGTTPNVGYMFFNGTTGLWEAHSGGTVFNKFMDVDGSVNVKDGQLDSVQVRVARVEPQFSRQNALSLCYDGTRTRSSSLLGPHDIASSGVSPFNKNCVTVKFLPGHGIHKLVVNTENGHVRVTPEGSWLRTLLPWKCKATVTRF